MLTLLASVSSVLTTIGNLLLAFVVLMIMITIHEFGHYTAGKLLKFRINEFSIGMGPKIFSKTKRTAKNFPFVFCLSAVTAPSTERTARQLKALSTVKNRGNGLSCCFRERFSTFFRRFWCVFCCLACTVKRWLWSTRCTTTHRA